MDDLKLLKQIVEETLKVDLTNMRRNRELVDAKRIFAFIGVRYFRYSLTYIGNYLNMHHANIIHYVKTTENLIETEKYFYEQFNLCLGKYYNLNSEDMDHPLLTEYNFHLKKLRELEETIKL